MISGYFFEYFVFGLKKSAQGGFLLLSAWVLLRQHVSTAQKEIGTWVAIYTLSSIVLGAGVYFAAFFFFGLEDVEIWLFLLTAILLFIIAWSDNVTIRLRAESKYTLYVLAFGQAFNSLPISISPYTMFQEVVATDLLLALIPFLAGFISFTVGIAFPMALIRQRPANKKIVMIVIAIACLAKALLLWFHIS